VLGVHIVGDRVGELMAEAQLITKLGSPAQRGRQLIHPHPTQSEAIGEAHLALAGKPAARARLRSTTPRPNPRDQKESPHHADLRHHAALGESVTEAPLPGGSSRRATASRPTSRCSRCPPTRSTRDSLPRGGRAEPDQGRRGRDGGGRRRAGHHRRRRPAGRCPPRARGTQRWCATPRRKSPHRQRAAPVHRHRSSRSQPPRR